MKRIIQNSVSHIDMVAWVLTTMFFCGSALFFGGDLQMAFLGAGGVVLIMFLVGASIEIMIETLKGVRGIGTITGFLTNGPEALVLVVGLIVGDILFGASTPLGSNYMNPILLLCAALLTRRVGATWRVAPIYFVVTVLATASFAGLFFAIPARAYVIWLLCAGVASFILFFRRPPEPASNNQDDVVIARIWLVPAVATMVVAGYFLDPVVNFASQASHVHKGVIGFLVLSTLTSWPEFKSCLALLRRDMALAAVLNIVVSNITNLWLAGAGVVIYLAS